MQIRTMGRTEVYARARAGSFAVLLVVGFAAACGSGSSSGGVGGVGDGGETIVSRTVTLSPETATLPVNQTLKISATLVTKTRQADGKLFTHVTPDISKFDWSVLEPDGGSIGPDGTSGMRKLYQAPSAPGVFHLQVVLKDDPSVNDTSTVTVTAQPPCLCELGLGGGGARLTYYFTSLWGNASDEVFLTVNDRDFREYQCGTTFLVWFDGLLFHEF